MAKRKGRGKGFNMDALSGGGGGGLGNMGGLAGQLQAMQQQMVEAQESLGDEQLEVSSGGGAVKVVMTGHQKVLSVKINPEVVDPDDVEMLEDLMVAAINEAIEAAQNLAADKMGNITGGLNIPGLF